VYSEKAFAQTTGGDLVMETPKGLNGRTATVIFHCAPCVFVETTRGLERRIFDPSLFDRPVSVEEWAARMHGPGGSRVVVSYAPRFVVMPYDREDPPAAWVQRDLDDATKWNVEYTEVQQWYREHVGELTV
jgi:hypothetical protein